jgi:MFS family permease
VGVSSLRKAVVVAACGNLLEMFDFMVFGYYARAIGTTFFPAGDEYASILLAFMTFGAGFLMRPLGALLLGPYLDRHGRRRGLLLTLTLMGIGTLAIAVTPGYGQMGLTSPLIVLAARLLQGLSAGVEVGGVSVYLAEMAPQSRRGFVVAWQSASQQIAVVAAALTGLVLSSTLSPGALNAWGWRVPFVLGSLLLPFLLLIRRRLEETPQFLQRSRPEPREIYATVLRNAPLLLLGSLVVMMTTVFFYSITAYAPTYGTRVIGLPVTSAMLVTLCGGLTTFVLLPSMGALSDRVGRLPLLFICSIAGMVSAYPALTWLMASPGFGRLLAVELWLALIFGTYNGALVVYLAEIMPVRVRTSGFALAYSLATGLFGGFTPALSTYLIHMTGNPASPGLWLSASAAISCLALLCLEQFRRGRPQEISGVSHVR